MHSNLSKGGYQLVIVGHPFAPIGMGEHIRCTGRALNALGYSFAIRDIYGGVEGGNDAIFERKYTDKLVYSLSHNINIFHINGDEVDQTLAHIKNQFQPQAYNIIYPVWELNNYPEDLISRLQKFDEIWAPSKFVYNSICRAIKKPVYHMPLSVEANLQFFLPRKYFSLPESSYLFLFYFDIRSYISRKNPFAVIKAFEKLLDIVPDADIRLVIKLNKSDDLKQHKEEFNKFMDQVKNSRSIAKIIIINELLTDNEIRNLVYCCDCFISLHRSEGFGRGIAEAMYLGKPVIATGYSGNMDYMNKNNSLVVDYELIDVKENEYPYAVGQVWAEPCIEQVVNYMLKLIQDRSSGILLGQIATRHIRTYYSYRAIGLRYLDRLNAIQA